MKVPMMSELQKPGDDSPSFRLKSSSENCCQQEIRVANILEDTVAGERNLKPSPAMFHNCRQISPYKSAPRARPPRGARDGFRNLSSNPQQQPFLPLQGTHSDSTNSLFAKFAFRLRGVTHKTCSPQLTPIVPHGIPAARHLY